MVSGLCSGVSGPLGASISLEMGFTGWWQEGVEPGQHFQIDFEWGDDRKTIRWSAVDAPVEALEVD